MAGYGSKRAKMASAGEGRKNVMAADWFVNSDLADEYCTRMYSEPVNEPVVGRIVNERSLDKDEKSVITRGILGGKYLSNNRFNRECKRSGDIPNLWMRAPTDPTEDLVYMFNSKDTLRMTADGKETYLINLVRIDPNDAVAKTKRKDAKVKAQISSGAEEAQHRSEPQAVQAEPALNESTMGKVQTIDLEFADCFNIFSWPSQFDEDHFA